MINCNKHKLRENKFGVVWCVKCGFLSNTINADKLNKKDLVIYKKPNI